MCHMDCPQCSFKQFFQKWFDNVVFLLTLYSWLIKSSFKDSHDINSLWTHIKNTHHFGVGSAYQQVLHGNESTYKIRYNAGILSDREVISQRQPLWHLAEDVSVLERHSAFGGGHSETGNGNCVPGLLQPLERRSPVISGHCLTSSGTDISLCGSAQIFCA